jgi:serine/threonine-protein kinase
MMNQPLPAANHEDRLSEILAAYLEAVDAGWAPPRAALVGSYPALARELERFFTYQDQISRLADPTQATPPALGCGLETTPQRGAIQGAIPVAAEPATLAMPDQGRPGAQHVGVVGDYELLEEIKRGGMGIVFRARQLSLNRLVALKVILAGAGATPGEIRRFRNEAEQVANLDHPNIVPVYEVGEHEGTPFFSMKLFEGGSLADHGERFQADPRAAAQMVATVARAVQYAHQRGLLHRDLKPANILLDAQDQPHVSDFGLAKRVAIEAGEFDDLPAPHPTLSPAGRGRGEGSQEPTSGKTLAAALTITQPGSVVGTPGYMSPEQAAGEKVLTTACDIFGLGAILYKLLTGKGPFQTGTGRTNMELVRQCQPTAPHLLNPRIDGRLEAICRKCLAKEPTQRYASAAELAEDLERWLRGEPPLAWPQPWYLRVRRAARRHLLLCTLTGLAGFAVALLLLFSYFADPDRPVKAAQDRLARGKAVTLVGDKGPPAWFRWSFGEDVALASSGRDLPFFISTLDAGQLKLLHSPQQPRFRFTAETRHDEVIDMGLVGIYFGFTTLPNSKGVAHYWFQLSYADRGRNANMHFGPEQNFKGVPKYSKVSLTVHRYTDGRFSTLETPLFKTFVASLNTQPTPWRSLAVEVTPEGIQALWEGVPLLKQPQPTAALVQQINRFLPVDPADPKVQFQFQPEGSLGLYVSRGKGSFRNVMVQPMQ